MQIITISNRDMWLYEFNNTRFNNVLKLNKSGPNGTDVKSGTSKKFTRYGCCYGVISTEDGLNQTLLHATVEK